MFYIFKMPKKAVNHCIKYAIIRILTDPYPVLGQSRGFKNPL